MYTRIWTYLAHRRECQLEKNGIMINVKRNITVGMRTSRISRKKSGWKSTLTTFEFKRKPQCRIWASSSCTMCVLRIHRQIRKGMSSSVSTSKTFSSYSNPNSHSNSKSKSKSELISEPILSQNRFKIMLGLWYQLAKGSEDDIRCWNTSSIISLAGSTWQVSANSANIELAIKFDWNSKFKVKFEFEEFYWLFQLEEFDIKVLELIELLHICLNLQNFHKRETSEEEITES